MAVKVESITAVTQEPETYTLMPAGLGALSFTAKRRKRRSLPKLARAALIRLEYRNGFCRNKRDW
jgi:hypothetical protein